MRPILCLAALLAALVCATPAAAQDFASPSDTQIKLYEEGAAAFQAGEFEKAVRLFQASIDLGPLNLTYLNLGRALFRLDRCEEARDALDKARSAPRVANPPPEAVMDKIVEYSLDLADCGAAPIVADPVVPEPLPEPKEVPPDEPTQVVAEPEVPAVTEPPRAPSEPPAFIVEARLGLLLTGSGTIDASCNGQCDGVDPISEDTTDNSAIGFGGDVWFRVAPKLYVGAGLVYVPNTEWESSLDGLDTFGSDLTMHAGGAFRTPLSARLTLDLRASAGLVLLFPGGDLNTLIEEQSAACVHEDCDVAEGPFAGLAIGLGAGGTFDLGAFGLDAGIGIQHIRPRLSQLRIADTTLDTMFKGSRAWLWLGVSL
mgnify:CR=1 FL=1